MFDLTIPFSRDYIHSTALPLGPHCIIDSCKFSETFAFV